MVELLHLKHLILMEFMFFSFACPQPPHKKFLCHGLLSALNAYLGTLTINGPKITVPAGAAASAKTVNENQTAVATLTADWAVTWAIIGGTDAARFSIDSTSGILAFLAARILNCRRTAIRTTLTSSQCRP